jgi:hypothetical protein
MKPAQEPTQTMHRVRVGMIGLALVVLLIGLASAIFSVANREEPVAATGAPNAETVANMASLDNGAADVAEPLAELGVAPSTAGAEPGNAAAPTAGER